jgi:hypothetical protein
MGVGVGAAASRHNPTRGAQQHVEFDYDYLYVGAFADHAGHKRPEFMATKQGRRLAVGKGGSAEAEEVKRRLREAGVQVLDQVPYAELPMLLASTRVVLVPDDDEGGGERLVLEARAAGAMVELAPDNNKLRELLHSQLFDHRYYAAQLSAGMQELQQQLLIRG